MRSPFAAQVYIEGNSLRDYLVGVVVPDADYLLNYCNKANIPGDFEALCKNKVSYFHLIISINYLKFI